MKKTQKTSLPEDTNIAQKIAAKTVHYSMYATLATIPISGIVIGFIYWIGLKDGFINIEYHGSLKPIVAKLPIAEAE